MYVRLKFKIHPCMILHIAAVIEPDRLSASGMSLKMSVDVWWFRWTGWEGLHPTTWKYHEGLATLKN